jgi:hypothetical protein
VLQVTVHDHDPGCARLAQARHYRAAEAVMTFPGRAMVQHDVTMRFATHLLDNGNGVVVAVIDKDNFECSVALRCFEPGNQGCDVACFIPGRHHHR